MTAHLQLFAPPAPLPADDARNMQAELCIAASAQGTCSGVLCRDCLYNRRNVAAFRAYMVKGAK